MPVTFRRQLVVDSGTTCNSVSVTISLEGASVVQQHHHNCLPDYLTFILVFPIAATSARRPPSCNSGRAISQQQQKILMYHSPLMQQQSGFQKDGLSLACAYWYCIVYLLTSKVSSATQQEIQESSCQPSTDLLSYLKLENISYTV